MRMLDWWKRTQAMGQGGAPDKSFPVPTDVIKVKNVTGSDRDAGDVLELGDCAVDEASRSEPYFEGDTPSHSYGHSFCVLTRPIPAGGTDSASVSGWAVARVEIQNAADRFASIQLGSHVLKSASGGGDFKLLGPVTATGEQSVVVVFAGSNDEPVIGRMDGDLSAGGSANCVIWQRKADNTGWESSGQTVEVFDWLLPVGYIVSDGAKVVIKQVASLKRVWVVVNVQPCT